MSVLRVTALQTSSDQFCLIPLLVTAAICCPGPIRSVPPLTIVTSAVAVMVASDFRPLQAAEGSIPDRVVNFVIKAPRSTQPSIPPG